MLASGLDSVRARQSPNFTRFDGNLAGHRVPTPSDPDLVVSPTRLETWAQCPHRYFMESVLRLAEPEDPEEHLEITSLDLGNLVHETLDHFIAEVLADPLTRPASGERWTDAHRARMQALGAQICDEFEDRGLTGRRVLWKPTRRRILRELDEFLTRDGDRRAETGLAPVASEMTFGASTSNPPLAVDLADGRTLHFRGSADRVDVGADGELVVVDYKTGSDRSFVGLTEGDPTKNGTKLQLPVYAIAAAPRLRYRSLTHDGPLLVRESPRELQNDRIPAHRRRPRRVPECVGHDHRRHH